MKYLLFDQSAISTYVSDYKLQSIDYLEGQRFVQHFRGTLDSEIFNNTSIHYSNDGIMFIGRRNIHSFNEDNKHIFCIDLTTCKLFEEEKSDVRILTVFQKAFRFVLRIWNNEPFSASEKINGTKAILFPFSLWDRHRLVIERSNIVYRLDARGIKFPLLAYKYNSEEPNQMVEIAKTDILRLAGEQYVANHYSCQNSLDDYIKGDNKENTISSMEFIETDLIERRDDFIYWSYEQQFSLLTNVQKKIVELSNESVPIRIEGAAGTGKTIALIMRAYRLLSMHHKNHTPFHIIFFAHSESTSQRNREVFSNYENSDFFLLPESPQSIVFTSLFSYCREISRIEEVSVIEINASESKDYQLLMIDEVVKRAVNNKTIKTFFPLISDEIKSLFNEDETHYSLLIKMLQHEFSVQIKGRTDCSIESYYEIDSISNGIPCHSKYDKDLIFSLFSDYQKELQSQGFFDVDDVTMEAISHLNAPIWRRRRQSDGFDYIIVDEMHLFNLNEQSVFHFLSKDASKTDIPLCFALDYNQAIGDLGNTEKDYISSGKIGTVKSLKLGTVFRNSPQIADFCASVAVSGTLMFGDSFDNPYNDTQNQFTSLEEKKMDLPTLHMYPNDETMLAELDTMISNLMKLLQCNRRDIVIVCFDNKWISDEGIQMIQKYSKNDFQRLEVGRAVQSNQFVLSTPYELNGLEFKAVIMLGVDEGRVPQTAGTGDISKHFIMYSAYNMLYLTASRAKYSLILMGSNVNGISSCLEHSIKTNTITVEQYHKII